jgi:myo-inositol-1(or 4)-monophosphatase
MASEIYVAMEAAAKGAVIVEKLFGKPVEEIGLEYKKKDGDTPRTIIDRESGSAIISHLKQAYPKDSINEEETGYHAGSEDRRWHADPFDGTSNAPIGLRLSTVGIALQKGGEVVAGVAADPFSRKVYAAEKGSGAFEICYAVSGSGEVSFGEKKKIVASKRFLPKERYAEIDGLFNAKTAERKSGFLRDLALCASNVRMSGSNIRSSLSLASGQTDIWLIDAVGGFFDIAPGAVLIPEAGGKLTGIDGKPVHPGIQVAIGSNNVGDHEELCRIAHRHYESYAGFR